MHFPRHRVADRNAAALVRGLVGEGDTMGHQPVVGRDVVVGEGADDLAVVVAIVRKSVGLHDRPVGEILEHQVGRVVNAMFLLRAGSAAKRHVAATDDCMAAEARLCLDHDDRCARFPRHDGGGNARRA